MYKRSKQLPIVSRIAPIVKGGTLCSAIFPVGIKPAHTRVTSVSRRNARVSRAVCIRAGTVADRKKQATGGGLERSLQTIGSRFP
jgi:hypothetical protein